MSAFTPHQEARIRVMIAEMIGVALRGADVRLQHALLDDRAARDGVAVLSATVSVTGVDALRRQVLGEAPDGGAAVMGDRAHAKGNAR